MWRISARAAAGMLLLSSLWGCGEDFGTPVTITGKITQQGQPVADAQVTFHAVSGLPAAHRTRITRTDSTGAYTLKEVYPAEYQVMVEKPMETPADPGAAPAVPPENPLSKYGPESPLRAQVGPDQPTELPFELE
jgi:hypothetical protein